MAAVEPKAGEQSLGQLFGEMTSEVSNLVRKELELAKVEIKDEMAQAGKAAGALGAGAFAGYMAALLLSLAAAWALSDALEAPWAGFLIIGVLFAIVAAVLIQSGRKKLQEVNLVPEETVTTLKEDMQWVKEQKS
jgi:MFS family permease